MVTKLRSFSTNSVTKITAFMLVVVLIAFSAMSLLYVSASGLNLETLFYKEYKSSDSFNYEVMYACDYAVGKIVNYSETASNIDFYYYVTDGKNTYYNSPETKKSFFEQFNEAFYAYENGEWSFGKNTASIVQKVYYPENYTYYIAFPDKFMDDNQKDWQHEREILMPKAIVISVCLILSFILVVYLIIVTGRQPQDKELHLSSIDNLFTDVLIIIMLITGLIWISAVSEISYMSFDTGRVSADQTMAMMGIGSLTAVTAIIFGVIILSLSRQFKHGKLIKNSMLYSFFDLIKSLFDGRIFKDYPLTRSLFYRQIIFIVTSGLLVLLVAMFGVSYSYLVVVPPIAEIVIIYWYIKGNNKTFDEINKGFSENIEERLKSERMKIELVTNVSHDLKTPLTSIISYVDLLSKEEYLSDAAKDYVNILIDKSNRLKNIVSDLFDLAKSNSGDIITDTERLDLKKLIEQTIADMEDKIEGSQLQFKVILPDEPVIIMADGKRLYRVFQNVIDNALKYSLKGTRVFIELEKFSSNAVVSVKNTACYEMNFTEEEIRQRFTRGDKSRTTDGSGLGLSIAESFTNLCNGLFKVEIDGDLFKVLISFKTED